MQQFRADATILEKKDAHENMKKSSSKVAHNQPKLFSVFSTGPKAAQKLNFCSVKIAHRATYDFA
jgi:hypothetical protein